MRVFGCGLESVSRGMGKRGAWFAYQKHLNLETRSPGMWPFFPRPHADQKHLSLARRSAGVGGSWPGTGKPWDGFPRVGVGAGREWKYHRAPATHG
jgi:hypothetical protein